jgi:CheY-like chemotaxis protein
VQYRNRPGEPATPQSDSCRVLIIDDNQDLAESLAVCLRVAGHHVEVALEGMTGVEMARRTVPDVVLCDIRLPDIDGYQVTQALRADPRLGACYVVVVTGTEVEAERLSDFNDHLLKPVVPEHLLQVVARASQKR